MGALDHDMRTSTVSTDRTWRRGIITFRGNGAGTAHVRDCPKKDSLVWTGVSERSSALAGSGGDDAGAQQKKHNNPKCTKWPVAAHTTKAQMDLGRRMGIEAPSPHWASGGRWEAESPFWGSLRDDVENYRGRFCSSIIIVF